MDWQRVLLVIDRFESVVKSDMFDLKQIYMRILEKERNSDYDGAAKERENATKKVDHLLAQLVEVLNIREKLNESHRVKFDARIEPMRTRIQSAVNCLRYTRPTPKVIEIDAEYNSGNIYDHLYEESTATYSVCS
ncbi:hypothetical protein AB6A40_005532 [Gnathostoma spinigerum]|uniref:STX17-like N-terminal domain-containing protein n=1 Tax=Gnathostoma spinigerum TaxID=75299 RepID=A0ABD6EP94_9BILA